MIRAAGTVRALDAMWDAPLVAQLGLNTQLNNGMSFDNSNLKFARQLHKRLVNELQLVSSELIPMSCDPEGRTLSFQ